VDDDLASIDAADSGVASDLSGADSDAAQPDNG
jgi:hypothetical protein